MLIHGDESSKSEGVDLVNHDAVGGSVASELLVRSYPLNLSLTFPCLLQLGDDLRLKSKLLQDFKGILHQQVFYRLNLIFWIVMGCGIARFGRRGLKTTET